MAKVSPLYLTHTSLFFLPAPIFCIFQGQRKSKKLIEPYVNFWLSHLYLLKVFFTCLTMTDFPFNRWFKSFKWRSSCCESFSVNYHHHFSWQTCSMELSSQFSIWRKEVFSHPDCVPRFCNFLWKRSVFFQCVFQSGRGLTSTFWFNFPEIASKVADWMHIFYQ